MRYLLQVCSGYHCRGLNHLPVPGEMLIVARTPTLRQSCSRRKPSQLYPPMNVLLLMPAHLLTTPAKLPGPGGARLIVVDNLLMKQQLLIINRSR